MDTAAFLDRAPLTPDPRLRIKRPAGALQSTADEDLWYDEVQARVKLDLKRNLDLNVSMPFVDDFGALGALVTRADLADVERYLRALRYRVERLPDTLAKDRDRMYTVRRIEAEHAALVDERGQTAELEEIAWALQELRVSVFAQPIGAAHPVSSKRLRTALEQIRRHHDR